MSIYHRIDNQMPSNSPLAPLSLHATRLLYWLVTEDIAGEGEDGEQEWESVESVVSCFAEISDQTNTDVLQDLLDLEAHRCIRIVDSPGFGQVMCQREETLMNAMMVYYWLKMKQGDGEDGGGATGGRG